MAIKVRTVAAWLRCWAVWISGATVVLSKVQKRSLGHLCPWLKEHHQQKQWYDDSVRSVHVSFVRGMVKRRLNASE